MRRINALGFIEVYGLVAAIEAADAMLKSAKVRLLRQHGVHPGQISLVVEGDLAACRVAVNAGVAAASQIGVVLASHVIGRPDADTETMILELPGESIAQAEQPESEHPRAEAPAAITAVPPAPRAEPLPAAPPEPSVKSIPPAEPGSKPAAPPVPSVKPIPPAEPGSKPAAPPVPSVKPGDSPKAVKAGADANAPAPARGKLGEVIAYIGEAKLGYNWKELKTHFPGLPQQVRKQLDAAVASGELVKTGARYRKPGAKE